MTIESFIKHYVSKCGGREGFKRLLAVAKAHKQDPQEYLRTLSQSRVGSRQVVSMTMLACLLVVTIEEHGAAYLATEEFGEDIL